MRKVTPILILILLLLAACKSTKYVPEGELLLNDVTIEVDDKDVRPVDVKPYVKQKPNAKILTSVKFHLWLYNRSFKNRDGRLSSTLRKIGEAPVIYSEDVAMQSEKEIKRYLSNKGFTEAEVKREEIINEKKKKVELIYHLTCNEPYRIASAGIEIEDTAINTIVMADSSETLMRVGDRFDLDVLDSERERIAASLKNEGYYDFNKNNISFVVDTALGNHQVSNKLILRVDSANPEKSYEQLYLEQVRFIIGYDAKQALKLQNVYFAEMDTLVIRDIQFLSEGKPAIKPEILLRNNLLRPGMRYSKKGSDQTHAQLSAIGIIRFVNIKYEPVNDSLLNCDIYISMGEPQSFSINVEGTTVSGEAGWAVNAGHAHKNLFRGAEQLSTSFKVGQEAIILDEAFSTREFGADVNLSFPKLVLPFLDEDFIQKARSKTDFGLSYDYQERPEYTRNIATADVVYNWSRSNRLKHQLTPVLMNYISIPEITSSFQAHIDSTQYLKYSYDDHVILGSRYAVTFQGGKKGVEKTSRYLRLQVESSGNMLHLANNLLENTQDEVKDDAGNVEDSYYPFFGVRFAQYLKFDATGVVSHYINPSNTMVYRAQLGVGAPYGNSSFLPFEKRYFGGGANGVRAWMIRSLGPGNYYNEKVDYFNQSGDINFVASAEYRFDLFWIIEGSLFADVGNTWAIYDYKEQPGAVFKFDTFYKQIAAGLGAGLRVDLNFFVFRFDAALKAFDPSQVEGERFVFGKDLKPTTHIAIGYPF